MNTRMEALLAALDELPDHHMTPAPWDLAKSGRSCNLPLSHGGGKIRMEGVPQEHQHANARILASAPTFYNASIEALIELARIGDANDPRTAEVLSILTDMIAWIHNDPRRGRGLTRALGIEHRIYATYGEPQSLLF